MRIGGIDQTPLNQNCHRLSDSGFAVANLFGDSGDLCWLVASASLLQCPFHRSHTSGWCFLVNMLKKIIIRTLAPKNTIVPVHQEMLVARQ